MNASRLSALLESFPSVTLAVVGDYFLDKYLIIDESLSEKSLETGLDAYQVVQVRASPGAAGTVAANLRGLGVNVMALGIIGDDGEGFELERRLRAMGVDVEALLRPGGLFTPTYTKPMLQTSDGRARELNRLDIKNRHPLTPHAESEIMTWLRRIASRVQGVVVVDQIEEPNLGVVTDSVRAELIALAEARGNTLFAVESRARIGLFRKMILKPNTREALAAVGVPPGENVDIAVCARELSRRTDAPVFVTRGGEGILLCDETGFAQIPAVRVDGPVDIVGAGDSVLAGIAAALCAGATRREAALVGNLAASVTIRQIGATGTAAPRQILDAFAEYLVQTGVSADSEEQTDVGNLYRK